MRFRPSGSFLKSKWRPRSPRNLRFSNRENRRRSQIEWISWTRCPGEVREVLEAMLSKAKIQKDDAAHVARQMWYTIKKHLVDLTHAVARPVFCQAKHRYVQIKFLIGSEVMWVRFEPADIQPY